VSDLTQDRLSQAPQLTTERLTLRPYSPDDAQQLLALGANNRDHLSRFEADNPVRHLTSIAGARDLIADFTSAWVTGEAYFLASFLSAQATLVGQVYVGAVEGDPSAYVIGYIVDQDHEGHGYVSEAVRRVVRWLFETRRARRLEIECSDINTRSAAVATRCGFELSSHRQAVHSCQDGTTTGDLVYRLTRSEWSAA